MDCIREYCEAIFPAPERTTKGKFLSCCGYANAVINSLHQLPDLLYDLLILLHPLSTHYFIYILYCNNSFAMCSIGSAHEISTVGGPFIVKLNGSVMLYLIERSRAVEGRLSSNPSLYPLLTTLLEETPRRGNSFVPSLRFHGMSRSPIFDEGSRPALNLITLNI
jgi:hypothetical protein